MTANLWIVALLGLIVLTVVLLVALQRWTAAKQQQMSTQEFRMWFQENYLGVKATHLLNHIPERVRPGLERPAPPLEGTSLPPDNAPIGKECF